MTWMDEGAAGCRRTLTRAGIAFLTICFSSAPGGLIQNAKAQTKSATVTTPAPKAGVKWTFSYVNRFPGRVKVFEVPNEFDWEVGETFAYPQGKEIPFRAAAPDVIPMERRQKKTLALVVENTTTEPWYFFANFHKIYPTEKSFGASLICLCINHVFVVEPKSTWARIVQVKTHGTFRNKILELQHDVVGLSKDEFMKKRLQGHVESANE